MCSFGSIYNGINCNIDNRQTVTITNERTNEWLQSNNRMHDTSFCILLKLHIKRHWCCRTKQSVRIEGIYHSNKSWFKFKFLRQSMHLRFQYYYVMQKLTPVVDGENLLFQVVTTIWCIQKGFNCLVDTHTYHIHAIPSVKRKQYHISKNCEHEQHLCSFFSSTMEHVCFWIWAMPFIAYPQIHAERQYAQCVCWHAPTISLWFIHNRSVWTQCNVQYS